VRHALRPLPLGVALGGCAAACAVGLRPGYGWTDYETEVAPAFSALDHGHLLAFLERSPIYAGSLLLRAPAVLAARLLSPSPLLAYRAGSLLCALALAAAAVVVFRRALSRGATPWAALLGCWLVAATPMLVAVLESGHPEEALGAALVVGALLAALDGRTLAAGALLGAAIANKEWALVVVGPTLLALAWSEGWRAVCRCAVAAGATAAALLGPALVANGGLAGTAGSLAVAPGPLLHPWSAFWPLGSAVAHGPARARIAPAWASHLSHPLVVAAAAALSLVALRRRPKDRLELERRVLALAALCLLERCLLDTWALYYYYLPFLVVVAVWELHRHPRRAPLLALANAALLWLSVQLEPWIGPNLQAALVICTAAPTAAVLVHAALDLRRPYSSRSSRGNEVSTVLLPSPTTTSSSILTPSRPGM